MMCYKSKHKKWGPFILTNSQSISIIIQTMNYLSFNGIEIQHIKYIVLNKYIIIDNFPDK